MAAKRSGKMSVLPLTSDVIEKGAKGAIGGVLAIDKFHPERLVIELAADVANLAQLSQVQITGIKIVRETAEGESEVSDQVDAPCPMPASLFSPSAVPLAIDFPPMAKGQVFAVEIENTSTVAIRLRAFVFGGGS